MKLLPSSIFYETVRRLNEGITENAGKDRNPYMFIHVQTYASIWLPISSMYFRYLEGDIETIKGRGNSQSPYDQKPSHIFGHS